MQNFRSIGSTCSCLTRIFTFLSWRDKSPLVSCICHYIFKVKFSYIFYFRVKLRKGLLWVIVLGICISIFVQFGQPVLGKYSTNVFIFIYIYIFLGFGSNFVFIVDMSWVLCVHFTLWYVLGTLCTIVPTE